ncbi:MAG: PEP-CTERM sorting domain-containing protein [Myxococcota bacterium]
MMRNATRFASAMALAMTLAQGASAQQVIAGWDFSQLAASGVAPGSLAANYVNPGTSGTATVASGNVVASAMEPDTNPTNAAGIQGGVARPTLLSSFEKTAFNAFATLRQRGQTTTEFMGLTASNSASIEFAATAAAPTAGWRLTFGGRAIPDRGDVLSDGVSTVDVAFGSTCGATAPVGTANLTATDQAFSFTLSNATLGSGCVVLTMDGSADQPLIDNVAVPEPGSLAMLATGVLGLLGLASRRKA